MLEKIGNIKPKWQMWKHSFTFFRVTSAKVNFAFKKAINQWKKLVSI